MVYSSLVWWLQIQQAAVKSLPNKQRVACLGITGSSKGVTTTSMEVVLTFLIKMSGIEENLNLRSGLFAG